MNSKARVISGLLQIPRMRARAIIAVLPSVLENELKRERVTAAMYENLRIIGQNTAGSGAVVGGYFKATYADITGANDRQHEQKTGEEIAIDILTRLKG